MLTSKITATFFAAALAFAGLTSTAAFADSESYPASPRGVSYPAVQLPVTAYTGQKAPPAVNTQTFKAIQRPVADGNGSERPLN